MDDMLAPICARNGQVIAVRFLTPDDGDLLVDLVQRLSPDSRYGRFHVPMATLDPEEVRRRLPGFLDVDGVNHVALLALANGEDGEHAVAVARFKRSPGETQAEAAVVVRDDWQRQGIAVALLDQLIAVARNVGIERFLAWMQSSNRSAQLMIKTLPYRTEHHPEHGDDFVVMYLHKE